MAITPEKVLTFTKPSSDFLCSASDNKYDVEFISFSIHDYHTKELLFDATGNNTTATGSLELDIDLNNPLSNDSLRKIKYTFSERILRLPLITTSLTFKVGNQALSNFRMIERHYFRNKLVKSFDFTFGFCIPGSTNTWEAVYDVPALDNDLIEEMIIHPFETYSDSFYFVDDELIMHNKARYSYITEHTKQKKSPDNAEAKDYTIDVDQYKENEEKKIDIVDRKSCNDAGTYQPFSFREAKLSPSHDESINSYAESKENADAKCSDNFWSKETETKY